LSYEDLVQARRALHIDGYNSYADAGLDGPWITPYHLASCSPDGPVLLTFNYLDGASAHLHQDELRRHGYLAAMPFNRVLDLALKVAGMTRVDLYVTHVFHMLAPSRSAAIPTRHIDKSFDAVARHELEGRNIVALGQAAARCCVRHGLRHHAVPHLSARGLSFAERAALLTAALRQFR
jgi:hypothetical protein